MSETIKLSSNERREHANVLKRQEIVQGPKIKRARASMIEAANRGLANVKPEQAHPLHTRDEVAAELVKRGHFSDVKEAARYLQHEDLADPVMKSKYDTEVYDLESVVKWVEVMKEVQEKAA